MADGPTQFFLQEVATRVGPIALVTMDNGEDWQKPNVFGRAALASLAELAAAAPRGRLERPRPHRQAVRLRGRRRPDGVPADDDPGARPRRREGRGTTHSRRSATCRSRRSPRSTAPPSAAVSRSRSTATSAPLARSVRHIGFPEVFLGIIPAWGGTQLAPRARRRRGAPSS